MVELVRDEVWRQVRGVVWRPRREMVWRRGPLDLWAVLPEKGREEGRQWVRSEGTGLLQI